MKLIKDMTIRLANDGSGIAQGTININGYDAIKTSNFNEKTTISELYQRMLKDDFRKMIFDCTTTN